MRGLRFARWVARLIVGLAFIAIGVLAIVGIEALPSWPWFIPGVAILLSVLVLITGDRTTPELQPDPVTTPQAAAPTSPRVGN